MDYKPFITLLTIIFTIIEVIISVGYASKKKYPFLIENIVIYFLYLSFLFIEYKYKFHIESLLLLLVIITVLGHVFIGEYLNVYTKLKCYDRFLHAFGSFSCALFAYSIINKTMKPISSPAIYTTIFIISLGISLGVLFEMLEFGVDTFLKSKNQAGLKDTNVDLIADTLGSIIAGFVYTFFIVM